MCNNHIVACAPLRNLPARNSLRSDWARFVIKSLAFRGSRYSNERKSCAPEIATSYFISLLRSGFTFLCVISSFAKSNARSQFGPIALYMRDDVVAEKFQALESAAIEFNKNELSDLYHVLSST